MSSPPPQVPLKLHLCRAKSCTRRGAGELAAGLEAAFAAERTPALVLRHDCFDLCKHACNVLVEAPGLEPRLYMEVHPKHAGRFAEGLLAEGVPE